LWRHSHLKRALLGSLRTKPKKSHFFEASVASFCSCCPHRGWMGAHGLCGPLGKVNATRRTDWLRPPLKKGFVGLPAHKTQKNSLFRGVRREFMVLLPTQGLDGCAWPIWSIGQSEGHAAHRLAPGPPLKKGFVGLPAPNTKNSHFFNQKNHFSRPPSRVFAPAAHTGAGWVYMAYVDYWEK